nr:integrase, catalytic region, zinc finger, CCHC-type, peptidase aspartic, catalytic [Tanacetum cinerariifolium]
MSLDTSLCGVSKAWSLSRKTAEEKKTQKIDHLARSLLIQGLANDIYSLIDSNETAKDLWDALERQMRGSEYGEQDRKEWKQYGTLMRQTKNLMDIDALYNILKQNQGGVNDALGYKKKAVVITLDPLTLVAEKTKITALLEKAFNRRKFYSKPTNNNLRTSSTSQSANKKQEFVMSNDKKVEKKDDEKKRDMSKVKCYNCKKEGHFAKDFKKVKVKDYNYYKTKMLLAKKDSYEQVLLAEDQAWMESSSDSNQERNANMVFMAQTEKVLSDSDETSSSAEETIVEEQNNEFNEKIKVLNERNADLLAQTKFLQDQLKVKHVVIDTHIECQAQYAKREEERYEYMIRYSALCDNDIQHRKKIDEQEILFDKMSRQLVEMNNNVLSFQEKILEKESKISELEGCVSNKDVEIEKCLERLNEWIGFENPSYFEKAKDLRPSLYDEKQTSSLKPYVLNVILEKIIIDLEDEVVSLLEIQKVNLKTIESLKSEGFESSENAISESENQSENNCHEVEKDCDQMENPKVIASGMFKLSVSQSVSPISMSKTSYDSKNVENLLSSNNSHLGETSSAYVCNDAMNVSCNTRMCDLFDENNLFIFDDRSVRVSPISKMPFRKKPHDSMNVHSKSNSNKSLPRTVHRWFPKLQPLAEPVAKWIPKVKRQIDKISKTSNSPRPIYKWVPMSLVFYLLQIVQICLWIIDSGYTKHMTGNRALLTNFMEKFLGTVCFGNNDFAVIAGYGDVVIGSTTIKKVYYVEGLGHNLFSIGQFCDKGLEVAFRKSTCFVQNEDGVDLLTGDHSSNLYTIALNEVASNSSTCFLAKASSSQS